MTLIFRLEDYTAARFLEVYSLFALGMNRLLTLAQAHDFPYQHVIASKHAHPLRRSHR
jgi:hypothetical protein